MASFVVAMTHATSAVRAHPAVRVARPARRALSRARVAPRASADGQGDRLNAGQVKKQLEPNAGGEDTPENILRVSRGTSFEGLKTARRVALEAADAPDGGGDERKAKVEWAFDALIAQSRDFFLKAVEANPEDADAHFRLGNFYQTLEKFEDAEACYRKSADLDNTHVDSMNNLAMILQETGRIDEAEAFYLRCVEVDSKNVDVMFNWATLKLHHRQDLDACRVLINQIIVVNPELKDHKLVKALRGDEE